VGLIKFSLPMGGVHRKTKGLFLSENLELWRLKRSDLNSQTKVQDLLVLFKNPNLKAL